MAKLKKAISITQLYATKRDVLPFTNEWQEHIGRPEKSANWIIYGHSGNGKTSYSLRLAKLLAKYGKVWYLGLEEGNSESFELACKRTGMEACGSNFQLLTDEFEELYARLSRRNAADFVFIDSYQYYGISYKQYQEFTRKFKNTSFIWLSHAEGKKPEGRVAKKIEYDVSVKIWVEGFMAFPKSRYGGKEPYNIYPARAAEYWEKLTK
ncbi:ATP-dependent serine protease [Croceivirga sp. JEA036]|uniref:ATP-dependent serine protease n=1 Tax=Croceivirga sp. JEA036 TaxID=2721162 RepID=UPI001439CAC9|nr:ATP-dependent serine protease [Croceivirga sp. JEA036]NJB36358.1 ATP-dependent serine protease [Croceivirga sp. JEA036]